MLVVTRRTSEDRIEWIELEVNGEKVYVGLSKIMERSNRVRLAVDADRAVTVRRVSTPKKCYPRTSPETIVCDMIVDEPQSEK